MKFYLFKNNKPCNIDITNLPNTSNQRIFRAFLCTFLDENIFVSSTDGDGLFHADSYCAGKSAYVLLKPLLVSFQAFNSKCVHSSNVFSATQVCFDK